MDANSLSVSVALALVCLVIALLGDERSREYGRIGFFVSLVIASFHLPWYSARVWNFGFFITLIFTCGMGIAIWMGYVLHFFLSRLLEDYETKTFSSPRKSSTK